MALRNEEICSARLEIQGKIREYSLEQPEYKLLWDIKTTLLSIIFPDVLIINLIVIQ